MALSIKDPEADRLARELSARTGETLTEAIVVALRERLARVGARHMPSLRTEIERIARRASQRAVLDARSPDEILGYDERGLPR